MALLRQVSEPASPEIAMFGAMRIHRSAGDTLAGLGSSSKLVPGGLIMLCNEGCRSAEQFLAISGADLGARSTFDRIPPLEGSDRH